MISLANYSFASGMGEHVFFYWILFWDPIIRDILILAFIVTSEGN